MRRCRRNRGNSGNRDEREERRDRTAFGLVGKAAEQFSFLLLPAGHLLLIGPIGTMMTGSGRGLGVLGAACFLLMVLADGWLFRMLFYQRKGERLEEQLLDYRHMEQLNRTRELVARERYRETEDLRTHLREELKQVRQVIVRSWGQEDGAGAEGRKISGLAEDMLRGVLEESAGGGRPGFCGNALVNTVLEEKARVCSVFGIHLNVRVWVPSDIPVRSYDLCSVFSNLLDNAVDACRSLPADGEERTILVRADTRGDYLFIRVTNPASREYAERPGKMGHGLGREIIGRIARSCQGEYWTGMENGMYTASVVLGSRPDEGNKRKR